MIKRRVTRGPLFFLCWPMFDFVCQARPHNTTVFKEDV